MMKEKFMAENKKVHSCKELTAKRGMSFPSSEANLTNEMHIHTTGQLSRLLF